jgi:hypothetical protein
VKPGSWRGIVNADVVNSERRRVFLVILGEILRVLGRILGFQNPVKYIGNFNVNPATVHFSRAWVKAAEFCP